MNEQLTIENLEKAVEQMQAEQTEEPVIARGPMYAIALTPELREALENGATLWLR